MKLYTTDQYEGMIAETVTMMGYQGDQINAYYARPLGEEMFPGVVLIHHLPGWDEWYREATRKFAQHGYAAISPNLYFREGHGTPEDVAASVRGAGGVSDDQVIGDIEGALRFLLEQPHLTRKVGVFGTCSGGRHAFLSACQIDGFSAAVDCWGGRVTMTADDLTAKQPKAPIDYVTHLSCPLLGIFGNDDHSPTPEQVDMLEDALKKHGKLYEFYRYDGAGHGFFYYHAPAYRQAQAVDGWKKIFAFFEKYLQEE